MTGTFDVAARDRRARFFAGPRTPPAPVGGVAARVRSPGRAGR